METITAVYENGVLRPSRPLGLREHQTVHIHVLEEEQLSEKDEIVQILVAAGLMRPPPKGTPPPDPVSEPERRELRQIVGRAPGKPISEIITEERGEL